MYLGDAYIMLTGPREGRSESPAKLGYGTQMLTIIVASVEAHYAKTKREGGTIWEELHETIYGERQYGATDLEGHRWLFSQHARDVDPESWGATVASPNFDFVRWLLSGRLLEKKHISFGWNFSCFSAHSIERVLF
jgi:hypothetical protein